MKKRFYVPALLLGGSALLLSVAMIREQGSLAMRAAALFLKAGGKPLSDPVSFRRAVVSRTYPSPASIPEAFRARYRIDEMRIDGQLVISIRPKKSLSHQHLIYTHGGAYVNALGKPHWDIISSLVESTGATVTVPIYPLAPEFNNRAAYPFLIDLYRNLLAKVRPADIILAGDSAGGGLALGQAIELRDKGLPMPGRILLFSPWLDLTLADPASRTLEREDVMLDVDALRLCGVWWAGGDDPKLPRLSPLYADLRGLPPIDLYQGTRDIFVVDARTFVAKARSAGVKVTYEEYPGAFHVFVGATFTPEAKDVFRRVALALTGGVVMPRQQ